MAKVAVGLMQQVRHADTFFAMPEFHICIRHSKFVDHKGWYEKAPIPRHNGRGTEAQLTRDFGLAEATLQETGTRTMQATLQSD